MQICDRGLGNRNLSTIIITKKWKGVYIEMITAKEFFEEVNEINERFIKEFNLAYMRCGTCKDCNNTGQVSPGFDDDPQTCHCQREVECKQ